MQMLVDAGNVIRDGAVPDAGAERRATGQRCSASGTVVGRPCCTWREHLHVFRTVPESIRFQGHRLWIG